MPETILVLGSQGQLGSEIVEALRSRTDDRIVCADIRDSIQQGDAYYKLNVLHKDSLREIVKKESVDQIYHLAAILSAKGEEQPALAWRVNMEGLINVLDICVEEKVKRLFWPSSIAVFGPGTSRINTPQHDYFDPTSVYGISKLAGELWCKYYFEKHDVDVRSIRYPGVISYRTLPGGGTTDYAVDIFFKALSEGKYVCFLDKDMFLPMIYIEDAVRATIEIMQAPKESIKERTSYNLGAVSFSPEQLSEAIKKKIPSFEISFQLDFRNAIAASWPDSIDDAAARQDWHWHHHFEVDTIVDEMIAGIKGLKS